MQRLLASYFGGDHWIIGEHLDSEKAFEAFNSESHDKNIKLTSTFKANDIYKHVEKLRSIFLKTPLPIDKAEIDRMEAMYIGDDAKVSTIEVSKEWFINTAARYRFYAVKASSDGLNYLHVGFYNISTEELALLLTSEEEYIRKVANRLTKFFK
jgi:hypothetical protein